MPRLVAALGAGEPACWSLSCLPLVTVNRESVSSNQQRSHSSNAEGQHVALLGQLPSAIPATSLHRQVSTLASGSVLSLAAQEKRLPLQGCVRTFSGVAGGVKGLMNWLQWVSDHPVPGDSPFLSPCSIS